VVAVLELGDRDLEVLLAGAGEQVLVRDPGHRRA
jgi:hypothetical protein